MKYAKNIAFVLFVIPLIFIGCSDEDEQVQNNEIISEAANSSTRAGEATDYYWYQGQKIGLNKNDSKKFILFKQESRMKLSTNLANLKFPDSFSEVKMSSKIKRSKASASSVSSLMWASVETSESLLKNSEILYEAPYFTTGDGYELGLSHLLYVKLKSEKDVEQLTKMANKFNVELIGNNEYMPLWYTLGCTKSSKGNALEIANIFYETGLFAEAQPDLMTAIIASCVNDTHFNSQWNLLNTGQNNGIFGSDIRYCGTRSITSGSNNIIVAVIDHGIQLNHPDLNIHPISYDTEIGSSPSIVRGSHGTACGGIIGALSNNNLGVAGIAPNSPLMSISNNLIASPDYNQKVADGFNFAWSNGASVISNSWFSPTPQAILTDAIQNAISNGRNGRGCVVVFATGNHNSSVRYPANAIPDILAVGAMSPCEERKNPNSCDGENWGSNFGTTLDIVAPGVLIPTTDRTGNAGYSSGDYILNFNGTSSACPHVAATAALILSENPLLTQKQVADIIESTAQKVGNYSYSSTNGRPNGTWHQEMGYGLLNTFAAVAKVKSETLNFSNQNLYSSLFTGKWNVVANNVNVSNNAHLTLNFGEQITINPPFTVNAGSQLSIYR
ncbi:peptidase S8 [Bacteroides heparinolyticus]|uniref:Peptidase S8 n=1 Tax=Prevotella heparinolytica TaxID=28113 RepID=A0A3P1ZZ16_9BACE|nr:S8 family serine peptidase [Bacteroides heparinolyticus]RRD88055.1 peptidase S8 [Bacteroides heparinolyticus]